jgi:Zn-dependent protease with chaperone function
MDTVPIDQWLARFGLDALIGEHLAVVLGALPPEIRSDFMDDPAFAVCDYDAGPQVVLHVPIKLPGRCIVLKRSLCRRPTPFARWVIAHELAHAYLRHGGRHKGEDPEHAADSLAADWGFPKPR